MKISAVYAVFNEGDKLRRSLEQLKGLVDEVVVVDLGSTDQSLAVASSFGALVFHHRHVNYVELVRSFAISKASYPWVLVLDPDERVGSKLIAKLRRIAQGDDVAAVNIARKNIFFGKWIRHTNFWPDRQIRFFKKNLIEWPQKIHRYPKINGQVISLPADPDLAIEHFGYNSFQDFIHRQHRYSSVKAQNLFDEGKRFNLVFLFWSPSREFLVRFVKHEAYLDGVEGVFLVIALIYYRILVQFKLLKLQLR